MLEAATYTAVRRTGITMSISTHEHDTAEAVPAGDLGRPGRSPADRLEIGDLHRDRASRTLGGLSELLDARPDLLGVHAPADLAYDAVRWSA